MGFELWTVWVQHLSHVMRERESVFQERPKQLKFARTMIESVSEGHTEALRYFKDLRVEW